MFVWIKDFFSRVLDVFRGNIAREVLMELVAIQRERALCIAGNFVTDVYVFDNKAYFATAEIRRHETIYYHFRDGKFAVLESAIQRTIRDNRVYMRFAKDELQSDQIGVFVPFELCFIKSDHVRDLVKSSMLSVEDRISAMRKFVDNYDRMHSEPEQRQTLLEKLGSKR